MLRSSLLRSWSCSRRQRSAPSRGKADFFITHPSRPRFRLLHSGTHARTHLHTITDAHTPGPQAGAPESRGAGMRATEREYLLPPSRKPKPPNFFPSCPPQPPESQLRTPGKARAPAPPLGCSRLRAQACLPAPHTQGWKEDQRSAGTERARGQAFTAARLLVKSQGQKSN